MATIVAVYVLLLAFCQGREWYQCAMVLLHSLRGRAYPLTSSSSCGSEETIHELNSPRRITDNSRTGRVGMECDRPSLKTLTLEQILEVMAEKSLAHLCHDFNHGGCPACDRARWLENAVRMWNDAHPDQRLPGLREGTCGEQGGQSIASMHYFAAWTDSGCLVGCEHQHRTVISAANCISNAGGYVIAVENGQLRALNQKEEKEFHLALYGGNIVAGRVLIFRPLKVFKSIMN